MDILDILKVATIEEHDSHAQLAPDLAEPAAHPNDFVQTMGNEGEGTVAKSWPASTDIVVSASGRFAGNGAQSAQIHKLITETNVRQTPLTLCWTYAFPPAGPFRARLMRMSLIRAAAALEYDVIGNRLAEDKDYADFLGSSVCSHLSLNP